MPYESTSAFRGLNNKTDPMRLDLGWLVQGDNVDVTDTGGLAARGGYSLGLSLAGLRSAYTTIDFDRMYVAQGGSLKAVVGAASTLSAVNLAALASTARMHWTEINEQVFFNNGTDTGIIMQDGEVIEWAWPVPPAPSLVAVSGSLDAGQYQVSVTYTLPDGRMTGSSDPATITLEENQALQISGIAQRAGCATNVFICPANSTVYGLAASRAPAAMVWNASADNLGYELMFAGLDPMPQGCEVIQAWKGRIYASRYFPDRDQSAVFRSQPLGFHLFNLEEVFMVPGHVLMMAPHDEALIVATDNAVHAYTVDAIARLAPYGVVPGRCWEHDEDDRTIKFWTTRGLCEALPFKNLTDKYVSVAPGASAGGTIQRTGGQKRFLAVLQQGGSAFNDIN